MIIKSAKIKIKKELSLGEKGYCETILDYLNTQKIFNAKGEPFSDGMIYLMLNEKLKITHARLERAIYACYEANKKARKQEEKRREKILKTA